MGKAKVQLGKLVRVPLREGWRHEANDFTPWLARPENLDELARALGLAELLPVGAEHPVGDFRLDVLCTDGDEKVVVENQLAETDHRHLGQILTYAAGVRARKVVWVAESFRQEHLAALEFLNDNTTEEMAFFGVQVELWRIDDSPPAPRFEVVARPNGWVKAVREQARQATEASATKQLQLRFWTALSERLLKHAPTIRPGPPAARQAFRTSIGRTDLALNVAVNTVDAQLRVELWMTGPQAKARFTALLENKAAIEEALGFALDWQELPHAAACRIASRLDDAPLEDETRWGEYLDWAQARLVAMGRVFRPRVQALD